MTARVLVVDDSPAILRTARDALGEAGYQVHVAAGGVEGIELLRLEPPDLVLVDSTMPKMNGHRFCNELEKELGAAAVPVVMMVTRGELDRRSFMDTPCVVDCISKPFSPEAVQAVVSYTLEKHTARNVPATPEASADSAFTPQPTLEERTGQPAAATEVERSAFDPAVTKDERSAKLSLQRPAAQSESASTGAASTEAAAGPAERRLSLRAALSSALAVHLERRQVDDARGAALAAVDEALSRLPPDGARAHLSDVSLWCDLARVPLPEVLQFLQYQDHSGLFQVWYQQTRYDIYLRHGKVVAARAENAAQEYWLGRFMVARGLIAQSELEQLVRSSRGKSSLPIGEKLVRLGHINAEELRRVIADQCCELVYEALRARHGTCCFVAGVQAPPEFDGMHIDVSVQVLLLEGLRRVDEWNVIEREVPSFDQVFSQRLVTPGGFTEEERRLLDLVDGRRSVRDLVSAAKMRPFEACRLLYRLAATRKIVRSEVEDQG